MAEEDQQGPREWQRNWWTKGHRSYEIYYPNKFSPIYPWENHVVPPTYPGTPEDFPNDLYDTRMNYEIKNSDQIERIKKLLPSDNPTLSIPITHLSHCIHDEKVKGIENEGGNYLFESEAKDVEQTSYIYNIDDRTVVVPEMLLPGYLTWWEVNVLGWYSTTDEGAKVRKIESALQQSKPDRVFLPPYLQYIEKPNPGYDHGCSVYGRNCFTFSLHELIENYIESRQDCKEDNECKVYFKKAGTFRYRHKISYVILVCMGKDKEEKSDIASMEGAGQPDKTDKGQVIHFQSNGFIAADGEVLDSQQTPLFISQYPIRAIYPPKPSDAKKYNGIFYSWDSLNFAFYYPDKTGKLCITRKDNHKKTKVKHDPDSCHLGKSKCLKPKGSA